MKIRTLSFAILSIFFITGNALAGQWMRARRGNIPAGAWAVGRDNNGMRLYLCRARHANGMHPGKIRNDFRGCHISYGGREITKRHYQVYVLRFSANPRGYWVRRKRGNVPRQAMAVGHDTDDQTLYLCRARYSGIQIGKVNRQLGGCDIAYGGREINIKRYTVFIPAGRRVEYSW